MVDPIRPQPTGPREARIPVDRPELADALKHGNIFEIFRNLPANVTLEDIKRYLQGEGERFAYEVLQEQQAYSSEADYAPPSPSMFPEHEAQAAVTSEEGEAITVGVAKGLGKAISVQAKSAGLTKDSPDTPLSEAELEQLAGGTLAEFEQLLDEATGSIIDAQMFAQYQSRMEELKEELDRIIMLAKSGQIGVEFIMVALAKVNATQNGTLFTWKGKQAYHTLDRLNKITDEVVRAGPNDFATMQQAQSETRGFNQQLQFITSDMQALMQNVSGTMDQVQSFNQAYANFKQEVIRKFSAQG